MHGWVQGAGGRIPRRRRRRLGVCVSGILLESKGVNLALLICLKGFSFLTNKSSLSFN